MDKKRRKIYPKVKGEDLLLKIEKITGSKDLTIYNGSLQKLAIECGFLRDVEKYWKGELKKGNDKFLFEYHKANKPNITNKPSPTKDENPSEIIDKEKFKKLVTYHKNGGKNKKSPARRLSSNRMKLQKSYDLYLKEEKRNIESAQEKAREGKSGIVQSYFDEEIQKINLNQNDFKKSNIKFALKDHEKLTGLKLLDEVLAQNNIDKTETSICILTGYKIDKIGNFRRAFAKAAGVQLAPLSRMIKEMRDKELLSKETLKNKEAKELFIDREKVISQVKRVYRNPKFRKKILDKYGSICSCCDIAMETLIEAAHIIPVEDKGNDDVGNGIPLCPTHHTAFDNFLFTINPTDNSIIYKEGLNSEDLQITKTKCQLNVSKESLEYRYKLFNE